MAADQTDAANGGDPEAAWPPRFTNEAIAWFAIALAGVFFTVAAWFRDVFDSAELFNGDDAAQHAGAYVLVILGLFLLLCGVLFALVEAKKPPEPVTDGPRTALAVDPGGMVGTIIERIKDQKRSTVLLSFWFRSARPGRSWHRGHQRLDR